MSRRVLLVAAVLVLAASSGCLLASKAPPDDEQAYDSAAGGPAASGSGAADIDSRSAEQAQSDGSGGGVAQIQNRQLIKTARVDLRVENYDRARSRLTSAAQQRDGFVSDSNAEVHVTDGGNYTTGQVTYRVPQDEFDAFLAEVNDTGRVLESQQTTEDVTDQLVDIQARLSNLRAQRERLRTFYEQAEDTEALLRIQERLSDVQSEIERLEARQQSLQRQVAMSTVTVELEEPRPDEPTVPEDAWYDGPLTAAFLQSVGDVVEVVEAVAYVGVRALPFLLVFGGLPALVGLLLYRRIRD